MDTATENCPTCGSHVDPHALEIMRRNRAARDAHFYEITQQLAQADQESERSWWRLQLVGFAVVAVVLIGWIAWISAQVLRLKGELG